MVNGCIRPGTNSGMMFVHASGFPPGPGLWLSSVSVQCAATKSFTTFFYFKYLVFLDASVISCNAELKQQSDSRHF